MIYLTKEQRKALKRVYDRCELTVSSDGSLVHNRESLKLSLMVHDGYNFDKFYPRLTYRQFRKRVHPAWDYVMVQWCGMWLGIEKDGYTHS